MEYQHGGDIYSHRIQMDYSANINPLGLPAGVRETLSRCIQGDVCTLYPDSSCRTLRAALGQRHEIPAEYIICGNGAADLIFGLAAALRPARGLLMAPTFSEYEQALKTAGTKIDYLRLYEKNGFVPDMEEMCRAVHDAWIRGESYDVAFLCNPNNPTGIPVSKSQVEMLARECERSGTFLAVDECFCDFLEDGDEVSMIPAVKQLSRLFVLKAFTKLYAMAGLRLGYGLCGNRGLLEALASVRQPWPVSGLAQKAGEAALKEREYVTAARTLIGRERQWLKGELEGMGFHVYDSQANYLFFRHLLSPDEETYPKGWLYHKLLEHKVLIRSCGNYPGLDSGFYRICIKTREENEALTAHIQNVLREGEGKPYSI